MKKLDEGATPKNVFVQTVFKSQIPFRFCRLNMRVMRMEMLFFGRGKDKESTALAGGGGGVARLRAEEYIAFQQCGFTMIIVVSGPMANGCFGRSR